MSSWYFVANGQEGYLFQRDHRDPGAHPNGAVLRWALPVRNAIMPVPSMRVTAASA